MTNGVPQAFERWVSGIHPMMQHLANAIAGLQCDSTIRTLCYVRFQRMQTSRDELVGMNLMLIMVLIHAGIDRNIGSTVQESEACLWYYDHQMGNANRGAT